MGAQHHSKSHELLRREIQVFVLRLSTAYDLRGLPETLTSWDNATVGSGSIINQVAFDYNEFGQPVKDWQSHSGAVTP